MVFLHSIANRFLSVNTAEANDVTSINRVVPQLARRLRQIGSVWRSEGASGVSERIRTVLAERIRPKGTRWPVRPRDVLAADLGAPPPHREPKARAGEPIIVNWVMIPPGPGSGGHTTIFRIIRHLEMSGFTNRVYFYDPYMGDHRYHAEVVRQYYGFQGPVENIDGGMADAHAIVATSWPTGYAVFTARSAGKRFYFVQDFEPFFHPVGAAGILAENTYRMGFHAITAGRWLADKLNAEFGTDTDFFEFGCDTSRYVRQPNVHRRGISYYARREAPRRGFEIGVLALELIAKRRPDIELHLYGDTVGSLPFRFIDHGLVTPDRLNEIYNRCFAGLSLSLTNVSLVPHEMLAAGCIPVVNEAEHNRVVLDNPFIRYAPPTPQALAAALEAVADDPNSESLSLAGAASVRSISWDAAGARVEAAFRRTLQIPAVLPVSLGSVPVDAQPEPCRAG